MAAAGGAGSALRFFFLVFASSFASVAGTFTAGLRSAFLGLSSAFRVMVLTASLSSFAFGASSLASAFPVAFCTVSTTWAALSILSVLRSCLCPVPSFAGAAASTSSLPSPPSRLSFCNSLRISYLAWAAPGRSFLATRFARSWRDDTLRLRCRFTIPSTLRQTCSRSTGLRSSPCRVIAVTLAGARQCGCTDLLAEVLEARTATDQFLYGVAVDVDVN